MIPVKSKYLVWLFISPLTALFFIIDGIRKEEKGATYAFAVFMAILAFLFPPAGDLLVHNRTYFGWDGVDFIEFWIIMAEEGKFDIIIWGLSYLFFRLGINFAFIRLLVALVESCFFAWIYENFVRCQDFTHKEKMQFFILLELGFFPLFAIMGLRSDFGLIFYVWGIISLYVYNYKGRSTLLFIMAVLSHFMYMPLCLLAYFCYSVNLIHDKKIFFIILALCAILGYILTPIFVNMMYLESNLGQVYMAEDFVYGAGMTFDSKSGLFMLFSRVWFMPLLLYFITDKSKNIFKRSEHFKFLIYSLICIVTMTWSYHTLSSRVGKVLSIILIIFWGLKADRMSGFLKYIPIINILLFATQFYALRLIMFNTENYLTDIWMPLPYILNDEYTPLWIYSHTDMDGNLIVR